MSWGNPTAHALGDSAITVSFTVESTKEVTARIRAIGAAIRASRIAHAEEVIAAYTALTVFYDSLHVSYEQMSAEILTKCGEASGTEPATEGREHRIPVEYRGPDLDSVAKATGMAPSEVVEAHSAVWYTVDLLGFVPGFAFMSEIDPRLELPRREQPRPRVPAGSVAIARKQTGIYPFDTPGGWHILGRTKVTLFDPNREEPSLFRAGDRVKFEPTA